MTDALARLRAEVTVMTCCARYRNTTNSGRNGSSLRPGTAPVSFTAALMRKDLELAIEVAGDVGLPVTAAAKWFLDVVCTAGFSDADFASVAQVLRERAPGPGGVAPAS